MDEAVLNNRSDMKDKEVLDQLVKNVQGMMKESAGRLPSPADGSAKP
jgi:hypothetical protein